VLLLGVGILGEYVGRIYQQVRERPRYLVQAVLESTPASAESAMTQPSSASPSSPPAPSTPGSSA